MSWNERYVLAMSKRQQIIYMQARIMRLASEKWKKPMDEIAELFTKYRVLYYIEECFEIFHVEGDEAAMELHLTPTELLPEFVISSTGRLLYDETSKLWWSGPSDIAEMFILEKASKK